MDVLTHTLNISFKRYGLVFKACVTAFSRQRIADIYWVKSVTEVMQALQLELELFPEVTPPLELKNKTFSSSKKKLTRTKILTVTI